MIALAMMSGVIIGSAAPLDLLVRSDDECISHRLVVSGRSLGRVARNRCREHAPGFGDLEVSVSDHRIALRLTDICRPFRVVLDRLRGKPKNLAVALVEFRLDPLHVTKSLG